MTNIDAFLVVTNIIWACLFLQVFGQIDQAHQQLEGIITTLNDSTVKS